MNPYRKLDVPSPPVPSFSIYGGPKTAPAAHTSSAEPVAQATAAIASATEARAAVLNLIKLTAKTVPRSAPAEMPAALKEQVPGPTEQPAPVTKEVEEAVVAFLKADPTPLVTTRDIRAWAREMVAAVELDTVRGI